MPCIECFQWLTIQRACTYPYLDMMKCSIMILYTYELHITACLKCIASSRGTAGQRCWHSGQLNWQVHKLTISWAAFSQYKMFVKNNAYFNGSFVLWPEYVATQNQNVCNQRQLRTCPQLGCNKLVLIKKSRKHYRISIWCRGRLYKNAAPKVMPLILLQWSTASETENLLHIYTVEIVFSKLC